MQTSHVVIANLTNGTRRFVCDQSATYEGGRPMARLSIKFRQRRHVAQNFATYIDAADWVNDAHTKPQYMAANGVAFFEVASK